MPRPAIQAKKADVDPWTTVSSGLSDIIGCKQSSLSLSSLHCAVGTLVSSGKMALLKDGLSDIMRSHFRNWGQELSQIAGNPLLVRFSNIYKDFDNYCKIVPKFYMLYDRRFSSGEESQIRFVIRQLFVDNVLYDSKLVNDVIQEIKADIKSARTRVDVDLVKIRLLLDMCYSFRDEEPKQPIFDKFIDGFMNDTQKFYDSFFKTKFEGNSFPIYLQYASEQFAHEEGILREIMNSKDVNDILMILHTCLLISHEDDFLQEDADEPPISVALTSQDARPIKWLVDMYKRFGTPIVPVYTRCAEYIKAQMLKLSTNFKEGMKSNEAEQRVSELIDLTNNLSRPYNLIFKDVFRASDTLESMVMKAWNDDSFHIVNNFCTYIDAHIKNEFKKFTPEQKDKFPAMVAQFYTRIEDKKSFVSMYETNMLRRFIKLQLKLPDLELPIINAVRRAKAPDFALKFQEYHKRIKESQEIENEFKLEQSSIAAEGKKMIPFSPLIFENRSYILENTKNNEARYLPHELRDINKRFQESYKRKHPNTNLTLLADVSVVEFKCNVPANAKSRSPRTYTISCDVICASIIQCVAEKPRSCREICDIIGNNPLIVPYLCRLCGKTLELFKRQGKEGKKVTEDDIFQMNPGFYSGSVKVTVPPAVSARRGDEDRVKKQVSIDKAEAIKAAAIRVMKQNFRIKQSELEYAVIDSLKSYFKAEISDIRKCMDWLENGGYCDSKQEGGDIIVTYHQ